MILAPHVVGVTLCQELGVKSETGQVSLVGLFQALRVRTFPSPPQDFTVYFGLTDGVGEGTMTFTITRLETNDDLYTQSRWIAFPEDRLLVANMVVSVKACVFPAPARYGLSLSFDRALADERALQVYRD